jgi:hypothetical protein
MLWKDHFFTWIFMAGAVEGGSPMLDAGEVSGRGRAEHVHLVSTVPDWMRADPSSLM